MYVCSLRSARNRSARQGEELVVQRFDMGSLGFVSVDDLEQLKQKEYGAWEELLGWLFPISMNITRVCVQPGAHLLLTNVPRNVQQALEIGASEEVVFRQISGRDYSYHAALMLPDGTQVLVQDLCEGVRATVLCLPADASAHKQGELQLAS